MDQLTHIIKNVGLLGYSLNAISYFLLALLLLSSWKKRLIGGLFLVAVSYQVIWSVILAYHAYTQQVSSLVLVVNEDIHLMVWIVFLVEILRQATAPEENKKLIVATYLSISALFILTLTLELLSGNQIIAANHIFSFVFDLLLATFGLILTEQFYRNAKQDKRWAIKFMCIGIGLLFAYNLYMYSHATLFDGINPSLWNARGFVNVVIVPLLLISAARNPKWSFNVFVSRHVVFYSSGLFAIGVYLTLMAFGGYYIQIYGGIWGREAQIIFLVGAIVVLSVILSSGKLRANIKIFLNKHFYENKYDYREEWMGFIQKLSHIESPKYFKEQILQTVAMIMHSRGALLFLKADEKYSNAAGWNADSIEIQISEYSSLVSFLNNREWIIDLDEYREKPQNYEGLDMPAEILSTNSWLIIPLKHYFDLLGFIILLEPFAKVTINWEDRDLLKAIGKQVSSYIAFIVATESLAEAEKFAAFNRLSAYVVHDMKNSVAQLDLIIKNAEKHKDNPEFITDSFLTVSNVVDRMKHMLSQLRRINLQKSEAARIHVNEVLAKVVEKCANRLPMPQLENNPADLYVYAEPDRFMNVIEHLITNAQDATNESGEVRIRLKNNNNEVCIEVEDTGRGMTPEFISNHLFKPFDTTKGNAGMGVGVFEAKEFVKYYNGQLTVQSIPDVGTIFYLSLPVYNEGITFESKYG